MFVGRAFQACVYEPLVGPSINHLYLRRGPQDWHLSKQRLHGQALFVFPASCAFMPATRPEY